MTKSISVYEGFQHLSVCTRVADDAFAYLIRVLITHIIFMPVSYRPSLLHYIAQDLCSQQVLGSFLTDDLLLKLNAVELMDAQGSPACVMS